MSLSFPLSNIHESGGGAVGGGTIHSFPLPTQAPPPPHPIKLKNKIHTALSYNLFLQLVCLRGDGWTKYIYI